MLDACSNKFKYVQPPIRESFKPKTVFQRSNVPIENNTIYRNSFSSFDPETLAKIRAQAKIPVVALQLDEDIPMQSETTHSMSYPQYNDNNRPNLILPRDKIGLSRGSVSNITTNRYSYVVKNGKRPAAIMPSDHFIASKAAMDSATTASLSYPGHTDTLRTKSFKPNLSFNGPKQPFDTNTTHKLSFVMIPVTQREIPPWARPAIYQVPKVPMESATTHKMSFILPGQFIAVSDRDENSRTDLTCEDNFNAFNNTEL